MRTPHPVSIHGGHSGQFCNHASDTLENVVRAYIDHGYPWVGITEHMPPLSDDYLYPEEKDAGLNAGSLYERFGEYISVCRRLKAKYEHRIQILVGFETETYAGSLEFVHRLIERFSPDYIVGSVHHLKSVPFDYDPACYARAADRCGGLDRMYTIYFDRQYEMIRSLKPAVVGHLDLIRIHDRNYPSRLLKPHIWEKIIRNLELVRNLDLILDLNLRPLSKDAKEPFPAYPILEQAVEMGIHIVPGDDSHAVADIDAHMEQAISLMQSFGLGTVWRHPVDGPR